MKLSDIATIKNFFFGLPHAATVWLLTFFFFTTALLGYFGGRHWYYNYLDKQHQAYRRDSLILTRLNTVVVKLNSVDSHIDSIAKHELLQDEKLNAVGKHIQRIDHGNNSILYEFRRLEDLYKIFGSYKAAPDAEKKKELTQRIIE
jgi:hypothetical protein